MPAPWSTGPGNRGSYPGASFRGIQEGGVPLLVTLTAEEALSTLNGWGSKILLLCKAWDTSGEGRLILP